MTTLTKIDWTKPLTAVGKFSAAKDNLSFVAQVPTRDGKPITDGFDRLVLIGSERRAFYANEAGQVKDSDGRLCIAVQNVPPPKPAAPAAPLSAAEASLVLAEELRETRAEIVSIVGDLKKYLFGLSEAVKGAGTAQSLFLEAVRADINSGFLLMAEELGKGRAAAPQAPEAPSAPSKPKPKVVVGSFQDLKGH